MRYSFRPLKDNEILQTGNVLTRILHTPGHTSDSLHKRLLALPDDVAIYPGHTSGSFSAAGISGKPSSTIGFDKRFNPFLTLGDRKEFIARLKADIPDKPAGFERIVAINLGHQPASGSL
ncbi:hypothetical protein IT6_02505 [Methylacidiphilum caldifontis]|nr:hypothetical protein [Methylacidiphilum caldifontis]QSR89175.1 hypothetical protein IT6_02505 [Methylacidiphilum caldifontis]